MKSLRAWAIAFVFVTFSGLGAGARAQTNAVLVQLTGDVDPALETALVAELGASGYRALFTRVPRSAARYDGPSLSVEVGPEGAVASAWRRTRFVASAPLPRDPQIAALGASSLLFETPPPPPPRIARALDAPRAMGDVVPAPTDSEATPELDANRGFVLELAGTTAIVANGATLSVGHFIGPVLLRANVAVLHLWTNDSVVGSAGASVGYVGRAGIADLEASVDLGVVDVGLGGQSQLGPSIGASVGVAIAATELISIVGRLGGALAWIAEQATPGLLLSLGLRVTP